MNSLAIGFIIGGFVCVMLIILIHQRDVTIKGLRAILSAKNKEMEMIRESESRGIQEIGRLNRCCDELNKQLMVANIHKLEMSKQIADLKTSAPPDYRVSQEEVLEQRVHPLVEMDITKSTPVTSGLEITYDR